MREFIEDAGKLIVKITSVIAVVLTVVNWAIILVGMCKEKGSFFYDGAFTDFSEAAYSGVCLIIAIVFMAISLLIFCLSYIFNAWGAKKVCAIVFSIFFLLGGIFLLLGLLANINSAFLMSVGMLAQFAAIIVIPIGGIGLFVMGMIDSDHRMPCVFLYVSILTVTIGWLIVAGVILLLAIGIVLLIGGFFMGLGGKRKFDIVDSVTGEIVGSFERD